MKTDKSLDCYGLFCPMPIIKAAEKLKEMASGEILEIISTDEGIERDMLAWCEMTGNEFINIERENDIIKVYVRKK
ncbi:sulfurtransferase TusA family protein [SCandidatus Aminicenantes bacterium Aminicenantia_JdfR_composite]|jgi:TusA-related sulfurtransferase|nr:sulfurtransferase TusA family protein [SCandidatus Aminicenantes bacterium Aminicenantia_JdfR_composite]MCP2620807.1 sulfurtransferase TusA family protein [Candidatus Aminicenantes bacterium AC-334-E05]